MRLFRLQEPGRPDTLTMCDEATPTVGPHDALVELKGYSLNNRDLLIMRGVYDFARRPGLIPLSDAAGTVVEVGSGVRRLKAGDRVAPIFHLDWIGGPARPDYFRSDIGGTLDGVLRERLVLAEQCFVKVPDHLTAVEAATLGCAGVTAWACLNDPSPVTAGDVLLIHGSGGVAIFALQFAKAMGAQIVMTTSSEETAQVLTGLGADAVFLRSDPQGWQRRVMEWTEGRGVQRLLDTSGPATLAASLSCLKWGSQLCLVGASGGEGPAFDFSRLIGRSITITAPVVGSRAHFEAMNRAIATHRIRPVIHEQWAFSDAPAAFRAFPERRHVGKLVIGQ